MVNFSFIHPQYLFLFFAIPLLFLIHFFALNYKRKVALKFANFDAIAKIQGVDFFSKNLVILILSSFLIIALVLSLSGLQIHTTAQATSFSFVVAIDSSMSMQANDLVPNRITVARNTAKLFVEEAKVGARIGVVSFAGSTTIVSELSDDKFEVKTAIDTITAEDYGGTDIEDAVMNSINILREEDNKAIILMSDGQLNVGEVEDIIYYSNKNDVLIHTIAMGTSTGGLAGGALTKLDEDILKTLSFNTGGIHFNAEKGEDLYQAFSDILQLTEMKVKIDYSRNLLLFSLFCFLLIFFLSNTKYLNLP